MQGIHGMKDLWWVLWYWHDCGKGSVIMHLVQFGCYTNTDMSEC